MTNDLIEKLTDKLVAREGLEGDEFAREVMREEALFIVASIDASGTHRVLPVEATPDMCIKGGIAAAEANVGAETWVDVVNYAYAAMLAAAPKVEE